jgi:hypothetical protein
MSVQYATAGDLASFLQQDVDTATATLALQVASAVFSTRADTMFVPTTVTYRTQALGYRQLFLPFRPIISIQQVRVINQFNGTQVVTDYVQIKRVLYRLIGFGNPGVFPPDALEVDLTHGYATVPDDVKGAVLETAATAYVSPDMSTTGETIDDYSVHFSSANGGMMLSPSAAMLADLYRGTVMA